MFEPIDNLQSKRFILDIPSLETMKQLRNILPEFNKDLKVVKGLAFFGSRTKATNKPDSDLDLCVFYDGSAFGPEIRKDEDFTAAGLTFDRTTGEVSLDNHKSDIAFLRTKARDQFETQIREKYKIILGSKLHLSPETLESQSRSVLTVDISQEATDNILNEFYSTANIVKDLAFDNTNKVYAPFLKLLSRFFLGTGKDLYQNRSYIFKSLEKRKNGEYLFKILMDKLNEFEKYKSRGNISFTGYPKTITEGKNFFLTE